MPVGRASLRHRAGRADLSPTLVSLRELLQAWFAVNGRELPWRETTDPYAILVSEVMLQQTQVERVVPRYLRWLERWPTVEALAAAPTADVIVEWQGLGYNRRAVSLQRAARLVAASGWPADLTELPGVGPYTAGAVGNFAFGRDVLPVDTNVRRVQERTGEQFDASSTQALFDLGATVCLARIPRCEVCPLADGVPGARPPLRAAASAGAVRGLLPPATRAVLRAIAAGLVVDDDEAVASLARDGLVAFERDGSPALPR